ncbi:SDR family NAD(P)-dependent oxidoreductase [Pandoraea sputorum]|uniref:SDR family NAD(P)-dependent oxidoreductase n=1 Tax=Pandoraea sputorum TaxID=93222 RepID=UPI001E58FA51|nr:SDR family NAD(P)-dependent oxidoreductase [Pandoraea sputorum]MCE4059512.1 SDR family NAD(P)-dependent oxidoreductase [Pandoraea sputorum]
MNRPSNTALITGASSGIGRELAKIHASKRGNLVLVARSHDKLVALKHELEAQWGIDAVVIAEDLAASGAARRIFEQTQAAGIEIDVLINNAGFGGHGLFHEQRSDDFQAMMQVNMSALTELTHLYLKGMVQRRRGRILNVSSTASFMPGPLQAVYYATKAYVTSFTQAVAEEVAVFGITATALCPGAVATGFVEAGKLEGVDLWSEISFLLGFQEPNSFIRAYQAWTGVSPGSLRMQLQRPVVAAAMRETSRNSTGFDGN